ncbi:hypothetical protein NMG60_11031810 [Bertholletia excelsa]
MGKALKPLKLYIERPTKSHSLLLVVVWLLVLIVPLFARRPDVPRTRVASSSPFSRFRLHSPSARYTRRQLSSLGLDPAPIGNSWSTTRNRRQFEMDTHEVPSGPNPESN